MNPTRLVLEKRNGKLQHEEQKLAMEAASRGIPVVFTNEKALSRNRFKFRDGDMVSGTVLFMKHAVRMHGHQLSEHKPYPDCLNFIMHRKMQPLQKLRDAKSQLDYGKKFFIKPATWKSFTGFVAEFRDDFRFNGASDHTWVYVGDVVQFVSEWRVYVANGEIMDTQWYDGDEHNVLALDHEVVVTAINVMTACGAPDGYVIDFGVLSTGETALVEVNDGFSIGAYGNISNRAYFETIWARWQQLSRGEI